MGLADRETVKAAVPAAGELPLFCSVRNRVNGLPGATAEGEPWRFEVRIDTNGGEIVSDGPAAPVIVPSGAVIDAIR